MNTRHAVIFDLFHTLIDPEPLYPAGFDKYTEIAVLAGVDRGGFARFWGDTYEERETSTIDLVDLVDRYCKSVGRPLERATRTQIDDVLGIGVDEAIQRPDPAITEIVMALARTMRVGVLSNCHEREVRLWAHSPLSELVDVFGCSCRIGAMKPEPRAYEWMFRRLRVDPAELTYVANGGSDELVGARNAGIGHIIHTNIYDQSGTLVASDEQRRRAAQSDISVNTVAELRHALGL